MRPRRSALRPQPSFNALPSSFYARTVPLPRRQRQSSTAKARDEASGSGEPPRFDLTPVRRTRRRTQPAQEEGELGSVL